MRTTPARARLLLAVPRYQDQEVGICRLLAGRRVSAVPVIGDGGHVLRPGYDIDDLSPALAEALARQGGEPWRTGARE